MKKLFFIFIALFFLNNAFAGFVSQEIAIKVAHNYFYQASYSAKGSSLRYHDISLQCVQEANYSSNSWFYVFNVNGNESFVIVSASDKVTPVLAYSFESGFNLNNICPAQQYLLDIYSSIIKDAEDSRLICNPESEQLWIDLTTYSPEDGIKQKNTVSPLLGTIAWNQSMPYNAMCPEAEGTYAGYGGRCPVGCSAIAMLQIMKYYNWPDSGTGSYIHYADENGGFGNIYVNFAQQTYDWYSMPNAATQLNDELAKMCFHAGVAVKMHWSAEGSGAWPGDVAEALINYFSYQDNIELLEKEYYSEQEWKTILRSQIDAKKPIFYVGYSDEAGHAWNCDGYQDEDYFHMNWGWGGYGNGFYTLDALGTSATPGNTEGNYNQWQHALINITPVGGFPKYCVENFETGGSEGSFDDGSSYENYQNNSTCYYVIEPECKQIVQVKFDSFNLAAGDELYLWDGSLLEVWMGWVCCGAFEKRRHR